MRNRGNVRTVEVDFFGQKHHFVSGMTEIALRSKAVLLMGFIISCPNYHYQVVFYPWFVDPDKADASEETIQRVMQDYAHTIENHVKKYPDHISKTN
jgi:lauroyl/myristoyl acyltransferase